MSLIHPHLGVPVKSFLKKKKEKIVCCSSVQLPMYVAYSHVCSIWFCNIFVQTPDYLRACVVCLSVLSTV